MKDRILSRARELGLDRVAVAAVDPSLDAERHFEDWIGNGLHGAMGYLARAPELRGQARRLLPTARSMVAAAVRYPRAANRDSIAAYARLEDYHRRLTCALTDLLTSIRELDPSVQGVVCVDTKPLLERAAAARAGIGFIGKNTLLMNVEDGPWLMLGILVVSLDLEPDAPQKPRCGTCTSCLDACPTRAFLAPYVLDARRCLSYWTIEHRGAWPEEFRSAVGHRIFGCDDCLTACPFPRRTDGEPSKLLPIAEELAALTPHEVIRRCEESFTKHFKRFAIERAGKAGLLRNALTALGNTGSRADLPLVERYVDHENAGVAIHARWAKERLERA